MNHIPAGMELFPAFDQSQLDFIKKVIDDCDYYLIILGGKYGSLTEEGISFTEAEYDYAIAQNKPVIALIHQNIEDLPSKKVEKDSDLVEKLSKFRARLGESRLVKHWTNINDLTSNAIISLTTSFDQNPQIGWRRNQGEPSDELIARYNATRDQLERFRERNNEYRKRLSDYEEIETAEVDLKFTSEDGAAMISVSADDLIREFAAPLKNGFVRDLVSERLTSFLEHRFDRRSVEISEEAIENVLLFFEVFEIAQETEEDFFEIATDKLHLLKGAFKKRSSAQGKVFEDSIPF